MNLFTNRQSKGSNNRFNNNFDFLRLFAASLVILCHSYVLMGYSKLDPLFSVTGSITCGYLGVAIFFVISGYLITKSWHNNPSAYNFFWKRFLRIIPGLVGVAIFTVFIIGPLVTTFSITEYFKNPITWSYFKVIALYGIGPNLPGVFVNNIYPNAVNGSLWTLQVEFTMYIVIFLLGIFGFLYRKKSVIFITFLFALAFLILNIKHLTIQGTTASPVIIISYSIFFMIGAIYFLYNNYIKYDLKYAIILLIIWVLSFKTSYLTLISFFSLPYLILYIANMRISHLNNIGKYGDFSYGLYIYAFPIQQTVLYFLNVGSVIEMFILSMLFVLPMSIFSWKFIESNALKLKGLNVFELEIISRLSKIKFRFK